jgi:hypothetical protein
MGTAWNKDSMTRPMTDPSTLVFASQRIVVDPERDGDLKFSSRDEKIEFLAWRAATAGRGTGMSDPHDGGGELIIRNAGNKDGRRRYSVAGLHDVSSLPLRNVSL